MFRGGFLGLFALAVGCSFDAASLDDTADGIAGDYYAVGCGELVPADSDEPPVEPGWCARYESDGNDIVTTATDCATVSEATTCAIVMPGELVRYYRVRLDPADTVSLTLAPLTHDGDCPIVCEDS